MLKLARVVATHPHDHSVDLVMIEDNTRIAGVQVLTSSASGNSGTYDLPDPGRGGGDKWAIAEPTDRDMIAVVGSVGRTAVVVGFLFPQISQMLFKDKNRRVMRHASDVYTSIDGQGNAEFHHPSGAYVRFGTNPAHEDLSGTDSDGKWAISKNTGNQVHIHIEQAGGKASLDIAPDGAIVINTQATVTVNSDGLVKVVAPEVTLDTPTTNCTGDLKVTGVTTTGGFVSTGAAGGATVTGTMAITGASLTHNGKNVGSSHTHTGVQSGSSSSGAPS